MAETYRFFDAVQDENGTYDREYNAQEFTDYFRALVTTGVMKGSGTELKVSTNGSSMTTSVGSGIAFILGRYYENDSPLELTHDTEVLSKSRIDRIVIRMDLSTEARYVKAFIKKGVASTNPVPPELTQTDELYEISLAQVEITGGQTYIAVNDVRDERGNPNICPWAGSRILPNYDDDTLGAHVLNYTEHIPYAVTTNVGNAYSVNLDPSIESYVEGMALSVKINAQNTGAATININGLGAKNIIKGNGNAVSSGNLKANSIYTLRYNGTAFILQGEGGEGTASQSHVLTGQTFTNDSGTFTGTMPNQGAKTYTPGRNNITIPAGYHNGAGYVLGDTDLIASNIRSGVNIFGVTGNLIEGLRYAYGSGSTYISSSTKIVDVSFTINCGFPPKYVLLSCAGDSANYENQGLVLYEVGETGYKSSHSNYGSNRYEVFTIEPKSSSGTWTYASGNYLYVRLSVASYYSFTSGQDIWATAEVFG